MSEENRKWKVVGSEERFDLKRQFDLLVEVSFACCSEEMQTIVASKSIFRFSIFGYDVLSPLFFRVCIVFDHFRKVRIPLALGENDETRGSFCTILIFF